jgi:hypothetical protein
LQSPTEALSSQPVVDILKWFTTMPTSEDKLRELDQHNVQLTKLADRADAGVPGALDEEMRQSKLYEKCSAELHDLQDKEVIARDLASGG